MTTQPVSAPSRGASGAQLGGGRYTLEEVARETPYGALYRATDATTGHPVSVHILAPELVADGAVLGSLDAAVRAVAELSSDNLGRIFELATEGPTVYTVGEHLEGHTLRELCQRKLATGAGPFSPRSAHNVIAQVCAGLEALHQVLPHGGLSLDSIVVDKAGRARIADHGLAPLLPGVAAARRLGPAAAPEVVAGGAPTVAADLYSVAAILYELVVGSPPVKGCQRPSEAVAGLSPLVDTFVVTCMHPQPARRPASVAQVRAAADKALVAATASQPRASGSQPARPSLATSIASPGAAPAQQSGVHDALSSALADTHERWLISKGKLDYGPFTLADIVEQIRSSKVMPGDTLVDNETGSRVAVETHPLLTDLVDEARQRRDDERRARAEVDSVKQEKRRGATLYLVIAAVVVALGGGVYMLVTTLGADTSNDKAGIASLDEASLEAKISFPTAAEKAKRNKRGGRRGKRAARGTAGGWDDSMDLDLGSEGGGSERLDDSQINPVLQRNGRKLGRCLSSTGSRHASIDFIVKGTGKVSQVRVNGETGTPLANCVRKAMMSMKFPSFDGTRTKANFDMAL